MKISELDAMLKQDMYVDEFKLMEASIQTPALHTKWMKFLTEETFKLDVLLQRMARLKKAKWEYYGGKAPAKQYQKKPFGMKLTKGEIPMYIEADDDYQRLDMEIKKQTMLTDRIGEAVKMVQFRHTNIRNAIDVIKINNGIVG